MAKGHRSQIKRERNAVKDLMRSEERMSMRLWVFLCIAQDMRQVLSRNW